METDTSENQDGDIKQITLRISTTLFNRMTALIPLVAEEKGGRACHSDVVRLALLTGTTAMEGRVPGPNRKHR